MKTLAVWGCLLFLVCSTVAQPLPDGAPMLLESARSRALLDDARDDLLYLRLDAAEAKLNQLARTDEGAPAAFHYLATASLLRGFLTDDERAFDKFVERSDSLKDALGKLPASRWRWLLEAEGDLQRSIVWGRREQFTKAALAARSALKGYEAAAKGAPGWAEPQKGLGLMNIVIGSLPSGYRRLLRLLGYSGSVEKGRRQLLQAIAGGQYVREEARMLLAICDVIVRANPPDAIAVMKPLYTQHPRAPLVAHLYGYTLLTDSQADRAAEVYAPIVEARSAGQLPLVYATYYFADARFKQNRFEEAARLYQQYLRNHEGPSLRAGAQLGAALSLEMTGRRDAALPFYRRVRHTRTSETEELSVREAQRRLAAPLSAAEKTLLKSTNALESGRLDEAERFLQSMEPSTLDAREEAWRRYLTARVRHTRGALNDAVVAYQSVVADPGPDPLDGLRAWSHFYTGQIYAARGQKSAARLQFEAALAEKGHFDRYLSLEQYVRSALEGVR